VIGSSGSDERFNVRFAAESDFAQAAEYPRSARFFDEISQ